MSNSVGSVTQTQAIPKVTDAREQSPEARPQPVPVDKVELSSTAQAALREAGETPAQTAKEASAGDMQAKRLVARQEEAKQIAAQENTKGAAHVVA